MRNFTHRAAPKACNDIEKALDYAPLVQPSEIRPMSSGLLILVFICVNQLIRSCVYPSIIYRLFAC